MGVGTLRRFHGGRDAYLPNLDSRVGEDPRGILDKDHREEFDQPYGEESARELNARERKASGVESPDPKEAKRLKKEKAAGGDLRDPDQAKQLVKLVASGDVPDGDRREGERYENEVIAEQTMPGSLIGISATEQLGPQNVTSTVPGEEGGTRAQPPGTNPAPGTAAPAPGAPATAPGTFAVTPAKVPPPAKAPSTKGGSASSTGKASGKGSGGKGNKK